MKNTYPVFKYTSLDSPVIYHQNRVISLGELLETVDYLSGIIPDRQHLLNLYEDRYYFLLGFLVSLKQQSLSLFPSTITDHVLCHLSSQYSNILVLSDKKMSPAQFEIFDLKDLLKDIDFSEYSSTGKATGQSLSSKTLAVLPDISLTREVAVIFTSGSTGDPKPYIKQWRDLTVAAQHLSEQLFINTSLSGESILPALLATVPAQHMYGLEVSIILALQNGFLIHSNKPFFPQDITHCLQDLSSEAHQRGQIIETTLITAPLHIKACIKTQVALPGIKQFISATAPLDIELAQNCEHRYSAPVMEVFGCTEVGSMAIRQSTETEQWLLLKDISLERIKNNNSNQNEVQINTSRSIKQFLFNDIIELIDQQHFILKGRKDDLINLAGKRTSLAYLNHHLQSYDELADACFYLDSVVRDNVVKDKKVEDKNQLIAFVVLNTPDSIENKQMIKNIRAYLQQRIETIFLPKKIFFVASLPRNATGKLPQSGLKELMQEQRLK